MRGNTESKKDFNKETEVIMDFGEKRIPRNNYSRTMVFDKIILKNCGCDVAPDSEIIAKVELVKNSKESFIKITPRCATPGTEAVATTKKAAEEGKN